MYGAVNPTCPICSKKNELPPSEVQLVVCEKAEWSFFAYTCTLCQETIRRPADQDTIKLLKEAGVTPERWLVSPDTLVDHTNDGGRITYDDVIEFSRRVRAIDDLAGLLEPPPEAKELHDGPVITDDERIAFGFEVQGCDALADLIPSVMLPPVELPETHLVLPTGPRRSRFQP